MVSGCVGGKAWPTANPKAAGPFQVAADKMVGPLAGYTPDPIYGDQQQRFNIYRPRDLATSGYCHPILVWANGHTDNPEQNPPLCVTDSAANKWCGQYLPMMNHLASHGFVVIASLSTTTSRGDPLPTIAGLDWLLQQSEISSSPYYHRLDTANIGQLGHSEGGMSTCMVASEPRYKALAAITGTRALTGVHTPMLFFCGGKDTVVPCDGVRSVFLTVTDQPAFFIDELNSDHGSWVYQGAGRLSFHGCRVVQGSPDGRHREPQVFLWPGLHLLHRQPREGRAEQPDRPVTRLQHQRRRAGNPQRTAPQQTRQRRDNPRHGRAGTTQATAVDVRRAARGLSGRPCVAGLAGRLRAGRDGVRRLEIERDCNALDSMRRVRAAHDFEPIHPA